jgi:nitrite reductase/ring-hydroxylating ferredoxin subunit/DMSO/TMAO reductase YedYZ heme-binding membrane subunit
MSVKYQAIGWNRHKRVYDTVLASLVALYLALLVGVGALVHPNATLETLLIRAFGTAALLLLHIVLSIGPLCRLDRRFLPLLYNRRHLGVTTFLLGCAHGVFALVQFHGLANVNPLVSVFTSNRRFDSVPDFPFQLLGVLALLILFVMAVTSHDFWLRTLTAPVWKRMHMLVYAAYVLLVAHVTLGALQSETNPFLAAALGAGMAMILGLHMAGALRERRGDLESASRMVYVCEAGEIPEKCAKVVAAGGERIAVFRYDGKVSAISNVCRHQNGPLGEGRIIGGCVTCPWHGYQYRPESGASPPPFTEKVPTFRVRIVGTRVYVDPHPHAPGTYLEPAVIGAQRVTA